MKPSADARAKRRDATLRQVEALGFLLDESMRVPGTRARFGVDAVIGLVPGVGDAAGAALSAYIVVQAARIGAPPASLARMLLNVAVDAATGAVPLAGDLFDAVYKANARNVAILRREMEAPGSTRRSSAAVVGAVVLALLAILGAVGWVAWQVIRTMWGTVS